MEWWLWVIAGLALLAVEMLVPGMIVFLFFGAAAIVLGLLEGLGIAGPIWFQWVLFSLLSVVSLLTLRGRILERLHRKAAGEPGIDSIAGQIVVLTTALAPGKPAKAELRGASWTVVSQHGEALPKGTRCIVETVEGLTLHVRAAAKGQPELPA